MLSQEKLSDDIEQITKTPIQESKVKEKDPKKVAAGKKLAEYNRRAKEALKEKMKREAEKIPEEETGESQACSRRGWIPEMSFTTVISIVGIGLTAINMFMSYKSSPDPPTQPRVPEPPSDLPRPQPSKMPIPITPKIGMY